MIAFELHAISEAAAKKSGFVVEHDVLHTRGSCRQVGGEKSIVARCRNNRGFCQFYPRCLLEHDVVVVVEPSVCLSG